MAIPDHFLDQLRARLPLSKVVGRRVPLVRKGREFMGLCPFHNEKTPSFKVDDQKGFYHCFGCGAHGNLFSFEMQIAGVSFPEAVERLAAEAGMEVPKQSPKEREISRKRATAREVMERAAAFFERALRMPQGRDALAYLHRRGVDDAAIRRFRLGYAPPGGALKAALTGDECPESLLIDLGLVGRPREGQSGGTYDLFRHRVIFPILDTAGRPVAFGGRILGDGQPKYLNSPETAWFHKGRTLYNLYVAREAARALGSIVVAEGYMDVIALARCGIEAAVAPLGTALTEEQMELLWQSVDEPVLCFDGDDAGRRAAAKAMDRALPLIRPGRSLRFALLPPGLDPDDMSRRDGGPDHLKRLVGEAFPLSEMAWRLIIQGRALNGPEAKAALEAEIDAFSGRISDTTLRSHIRRDFRDRFWALLRPPATSGRFRDGSARKGARPEPPAPPLPPPKPSRPRHERLLLALMIAHPGLFESGADRLGEVAFSEPGLDKLRRVVVSLLSSSKSLDSSSLRDHLTLEGHGIEVAALMDSLRPGYGRVLADTADPAWVKANWDHTFEMYIRLDLLADVQIEKERLKQNLTQEGLDRLTAIREEDAAVIFQEFREPPENGVS